MSKKVIFPLLIASAFGTTSPKHRHKHDVDSDSTSESEVLKLPGVRDVLSNSVNTISRLKAQVTQLNARIRDIAAQEQKRVAAAKMEFEKQLAASEREVEHADKQNGELKEENVNLVAASEVLQHRAKSILDENRNLKASLSSLKDKVQMGVNYATKMERNVDDKGSNVLAVMKERSGGGFEGESDSLESSSVESSSDIGSSHSSSFVGSGSSSKSSNSASTAKSKSASEKESNSEESDTSFKSLSSESLEDEKSKGGNSFDKDINTDEQAEDLLSKSAETDDMDDDSTTSSSFLQLRKTGIKSESAVEKLENKQKFDSTADGSIEGGSQAFDMELAGAATSLDNKPKQETGDFDSGYMLGVLNHELKQLKAEEDASIRSLSLAFEKRQKMFRHDKERVLRVQQKLLKRQMKLKHRKFLLESAVKYLENQRSQLSAALVQLGGYLRDLAHIALSPPRESGRILPNLAVSMDGKKISVKKNREV